MVTLLSIVVLIGAAAWAVSNFFFRSTPAERWPVRIRFVDLWSWRGTVDRGTYVFVGVVGFAIKHNIDRLIATQLFGRPFTPFNYWIPPVSAIRVADLSADEATFLTALVAAALPFIWIGLSMTVRRLKSAGLPMGLVVLFFAPVVNLGFFALLSLIPPRTDNYRRETPRQFALAALVPQDRWGSSALAVALTSAIGVLAIYIGVQKLGTYGWGVFVALPFCLGLASVLIYTYHQPRTLAGCLGVSMISLAMMAFLLFAVAVDGLICIVMALPIAIPLALFGAFIGYLAQRRDTISSEAPTMMVLLMLLPVGVMSTERASAPEPPRLSVFTTIRIDAPAAEVWKNLIAFPDVPSPPSSLFRFGVSYPIRARITGAGVGAIRECLFSTGTWVERVNIWEEGRRLGFSVVSGPEVMRELSPYDIHPRHLDGYFVPESAEFRLNVNPDGSTQLEGMSWYRNSMWPAAYWRLWSDAVLHQVHLRVFEHVKTLSERPAIRGRVRMDYSARSSDRGLHVN